MQQELTLTVMTTEERQEYARHTTIIKRGLRNFIEVGNSLRTVRDKRLYRADYGTFEQYCDQELELSRRRAYQLMDAAQLNDNLCTTVHKLPKNEAQARPLTGLPPDEQREAWQEAVNTAPNGNPTAAHVESVVNTIKRGASQQVQVTIFSSESNEYYTPPEYIEAARAVLGRIDLDPASCEAAQQTVKAERFYTKDDNGLIQEWYGAVWLNPPYGTTAGQSNQGIWAQKLIREYLKGRTTEAVLLVKAALGYNWFEDLWYHWPVCFARERLSFIKPDGTNEGQSKQGTAFVYVGPNVEKFKEVFSQFGRVIMPEYEDKWRTIALISQVTVS